MLQILCSSVWVKLLARAELIFLGEQPDDFFFCEEPFYPGPGQTGRPSGSGPVPLQSPVPAPGSDIVRVGLSLGQPRASHISRAVPASRLEPKLVTLQFVGPRPNTCNTRLGPGLHTITINKWRVLWAEGIMGVLNILSSIFQFVCPQYFFFTI